MDQSNTPIIPIFKGFHHFLGWNISYPIEAFPETDVLLFGKFLCSSIQILASDPIVLSEIHRRMIPHVDADNPYPSINHTYLKKHRLSPDKPERHSLQEYDLYLLNQIHEARQKSLNEITLSEYDISALPVETEEEEIRRAEAWDNYFKEIRESTIYHYLEPFYSDKRDAFGFAQELLDAIMDSEDDKNCVIRITNDVELGWINVLSAECLLVNTVFIKDEESVSFEWSVSPDVFHAICAYVNGHIMAYQKWECKKIDYLRQKKYLMCFSKQELFEFPIFYIYDLLGNGEILPVLFDIIGDNSFDRRLRYFIRETLISLGKGNMTNLRLLQKYADRYKQINGASLSFWPWYYPDIKEEFLSYYKALRGTTSIEEPVVYRFVDLCLPTIVEAVLPTIENANQAVGLILLIQNAKGFDDEWVKSPFSPFMNRLVQILHLEAFQGSMLNVRASNAATRKAAVLLRDKHDALRKYTYAPEGD